MALKLLLVIKKQYTAAIKNLISLSAWKKAHYMTSINNVRKIDKVILHCAATPDYKEDDPKFDSFGLEQIKKWHIEENGWSDVGYHFIIRRTGEVEKGRPIDIQGAHTRGHNKGSLGVCLVGTRWPTDAQVKSLITLYRQINRSLGVDSTNWYGHNEFTDHKTCPGIPMSMVRALLKRA